MEHNVRKMSLEIHMAGPLEEMRISQGAVCDNVSNSRWEILLRALKKEDFFIYIGLYLNNNVIVLGGQQKNSAIHKHVSILTQTLLPSRLPHNIE